jgi:hypothetical protein
VLLGNIVISILRSSKLGVSGSGETDSITALVDNDIDVGMAIDSDWDETPPRTEPFVVVVSSLACCRLLMSAAVGVKFPILGPDVVDDDVIKILWKVTNECQPQTTQYQSI